MKKINIFLFLLILVFNNTGCRKFTEVDVPATSLNGDNVFEQSANAISVLNGIYARMSNGFFSDDLTSISLIGDLYADNLQMYDLQNLSYVPYYKNELSANTLFGSSASVWSNIYFYIYTSNFAIEGIQKSKLNDQRVKSQLLGEAYFVRAFCYFYLVNLFGDVPLLLSSDYAINEKLPREKTSEIYKSIISDLIRAKELLSNQYLDNTLLSKSEERVRPTKMAASALLSRTYLFVGDYSAAIGEATRLLNDNNFELLASLHDVFIKNSKETIWSLQPVSLGINTGEGNVFIPSDAGLNVLNPFYLSDDLIRQLPLADLRRQNWTDSLKMGVQTYTFSTKYRIKSSSVLSEYTVMFRLAEQYLIRAEARAETGDLTGANDDLNKIRKRAGLKEVNIASKNAFKLSIIEEKRKEFFLEGGERLFDLKRTGQIDNVMNTYSIAKGATWASYKSFFPIPTEERQRNANLTQNTGY